MIEGHQTWSDASSERDLLNAARQGDAAALTVLFERHDDGLRRFVYALLYDTSTLDDVLQDAYVKACSALRDFRGDASFKTWLHRIAFSAAIDRSRKRVGVPVSDDVLERVEDSMSAPDTQSAARLDVANALRQLPEQQRGAVLLVDAHGFSNTDAAQVLGIAPGTVGVHLSRGRAALRSLLGMPEQEVSEGVEQ